MKEIKGVVSVASKFHADYTAEALHMKNMLYKFIAGKKFKNNKTIPDSKIINIQIPQYLGYIQRKLPLIGHKIPYNIVSDFLFDYIAKEKIKDDIDFFIGFNNFCEYQFKQLKMRKTTLFLEQRIAHVDTEIETYLNEFGEIPQNLSPKMISRKKREYELADYILVPSNFVETSMLENGIPANKLIKIPYGYDPKLFYCKAKNKIENKKLKAIFVGQIGYRKGIKYLLQAVKQLVDSGSTIELILVGNVDKNIQSLLNENQEYFKHIKFLPQQELLNLYNESDVFIFPSLCEGSARVMYEAAACGIPMIVTENSGGFISNGKEGFIIPAANSTAIVEAVRKLENNYELRIWMRDQTLETIQEYTWSKYSERLTDKITEILSNTIRR